MDERLSAECRAMASGKWTTWRTATDAMIGEDPLSEVDDVPTDCIEFEATERVESRLEKQTSGGDVHTEYRVTQQC